MEIPAVNKARFIKQKEMHLEIEFSKQEKKGRKKHHLKPFDISPNMPCYISEIVMCLERYFFKCFCIHHLGTVKAGLQLMFMTKVRKSIAISHVNQMVAVCTCFSFYSGH